MRAQPFSDQCREPCRLHPSPVAYRSKRWSLNKQAPRTNDSQHLTCICVHAVQALARCSRRCSCSTQSRPFCKRCTSAAAFSHFFLQPTPSPFPEASSLAASVIGQVATGGKHRVSPSRKCGTCSSWQAGAQRLSALANFSESGALAAIDSDAIPKLLHVLEHSDDQGACHTAWHLRITIYCECNTRTRMQRTSCSLAMSFHDVRAQA